MDSITDFLVISFLIFLILKHFQISKESYLQIRNNFIEKNKKNNKNEFMQVF